MGFRVRFEPATFMADRLSGSRMAYVRTDVILLLALRLAMQGQIATLPPVTPRSLQERERDGSPHVHMQDNWWIRDLHDGYCLTDDKPYAGWVAYGTRRRPARPALLATLQGYPPAVVLDFVQRTRALLTRIFD